ncbi:MAG TPA: beta-propeller fold lactonase family protein [Acidobacteriaceae bacterium]|nr:beta-propeller fold lactonase family protein [Acidobacteriaceae bacterium]
MRSAKYLLLPLLGLICGCGKFFPDSTGGGGGGSTGNYLYVANVTGSSIGGFSVGTGGLLTALNNGATFPVAAAPTALAATPSGSFLYVGGQSGAIYAFTINADGSLVAANNGAAVATGFSPFSIAIDSTGTWLFSVDSTTSTLFEYQINPTTGVLTAGNPGAIALDTGSPQQVYVTPNNQLLYVPLQTGGVDIFTFDPTTGAIANRQLLKPIASPNADAAALADPTTKFLFVAETGVNGVRVFTIGTNGALTEVAGSPHATGLGPNALVMDPTGAFLYVANKTANNISGFSLGVNGGLTLLPSSPFIAGTIPTAMTLDQTGKFLAVASAGGNPDLQVFSFDATTGGKLDPVAHASSGTDPVNAIAIVSAK